MGGVEGARSSGDWFFRRSWILGWEVVRGFWRLGFRGFRVRMKVVFVLFGVFILGLGEKRKVRFGFVFMVLAGLFGSGGGIYRVLSITC